MHAKLLLKSSNLLLIFIIYHVAFISAATFSAFWENVVWIELMEHAKGINMFIIYKYITRVILRKILVVYFTSSTRSRT